MPPFQIPSRSRALYLSRIEKVLLYIERNLSAPLELETLASESNFSPFHFHRIFSALMDESPQAYINRQRLERAANLLVKSPGLAITGVALETGFSTPSNFTRSFKKHFGCTPGDYARRHRSDDAPYPWVAAKSSPPGPSAFHLPAVHVRLMPALHLAYFTSKHGYDTDAVKEVWLRLFNWASSRGIDYRLQQLVAISYDDPQITPPAKCRYQACLTVPPGMLSDTRANLMDIPETLCAVCRLAIDSPEFPAAYKAIYRDWLPDSGFMLGSLPPYELVHNAPDVDPSSKYVFDLCVPVEAI